MMRKAHLLLLLFLINSAQAGIISEPLCHSTFKQVTVNRGHTVLYRSSCVLGVEDVPGELGILLPFGEKMYVYEVGSTRGDLHQQYLKATYQMGQIRVEFGYRAHGHAVVRFEHDYFYEELKESITHLAEELQGSLKLL